MAVSKGAISLWCSFKIRKVRLSRSAALPIFSFKSCFDIPFTVILMSGMVEDVTLIQQSVSVLE